MSEKTCEHSPEFLAACGDERPGLFPAVDMVFDLIRTLRYAPDVAPAWTAAPGSPDGLAAIRALADALGWRAELIQQRDVAPIVEAGVGDLLITAYCWGWGAERARKWEDRIELSNSVWAEFQHDPTAFHRLLHALLAFAPGGN